MSFRGFMPKATTTTDKSYPNFEHVRFNLRQAWNTTYESQLKASVQERVITPFRAVNNAGDILSRQNYSCGGSCQTSQSRPGLKGLKGRMGAIHSACDATSVPPASCNGKYVYDSSDYVTYLKQKAYSQNYNDLSNGGDNNSASQSAIRGIRRF
jgi:hypothetical protein